MSSSKVSGGIKVLNNNKNVSSDVEVKEVVKLREREGQRVDLGRSLKGLL